MLLLIVDVETTGTNPQCDRVLELGAILYSVPEQTTVAQVSTLIPSLDNPVESINGIVPSATQRVGQTYAAALGLFEVYLAQADYLVAHNADFDRQWLGKAPLPNSPKPWLCTAKDFVWPKVRRKKVSLSSLALSYGISGIIRHRALADCQIIAAVFDRVHPLEDFVHQAIQRCLRPQLGNAVAEV
jgi:DNA polymerase-3 subunit epsilon